MKTSEFKSSRMSGYKPKSITVIVGEKTKKISSIENVTGYLDERYSGVLDMVSIEDKSFDVRFLHELIVNFVVFDIELMDWVFDEMDKFNMPIFSITMINEQNPHLPDILINNEESNDPAIVEKLKTILVAQWRALT